MRVLVIGATGRVGGRVVRRLLDHGHDVFAVVRRSTARLPDAVRRVDADVTRPASLAALPGVDGVFLVFPSLQADQWAAELIAALAARSPQIVYLSAQGAQDAQPGEGIMGSHALLEGLIDDAGVGRTFLRSSGFAANTLAWAPQIAAGGPVRWMYGDARRVLIHEDDLAAVAVQALETRDAGDGIANSAHHLTGPQQLTQREYAGVVGDVIGRRVEFVELNDDEAIRELFSDLPEAFGRSIIRGQAAMVKNPEPLTTTVPDLLGRPARSFAQWVADHRAAFAPT